VTPTAIERLNRVQTDVLRPVTKRDEHDLLSALRVGDEEAFGQLIDRYYRAMLYVAQGFVRTNSAAEEVVQDTLLAVVEGLPRFEGRSSLKTWMFRILVNRARTRGARQRRCLTFSCLRSDRANPRNDLTPPADASTAVGTESASLDPAAVVLNQELGDALWAAVDQLPAPQRQVLVLRDVEGGIAAEVCDILGLSDANQRILLHRARTRVRAQLLPYLNR
jgi:RNA polymerase sigma-70 factor (ECF subfamily)